MDAEGECHYQGHRRVFGSGLRQYGGVGPAAAALLRPHAGQGGVTEAEDEAGQQASDAGAASKGRAGDARLGPGEEA